MTGHRATPFRAFALVRAIIDDPRFAGLGAPAQSAILVAVARHADHDGRWYIKADTLAAPLGRSGRRVRDALNDCRKVGLLLATRRRRPDGTLSVYDFELDDVVTAQADENVRLWTKASAGASADENVRSPSADESVRAGTALKSSMKGLGRDGEDAVAGDHKQWWLDNVAIEYAHDAVAFAEEAASVLRVGADEAERIRVALRARNSV